VGQVGVDRREPLERGVVDRGDDRVVAVLGDDLLERGIDAAQAQQQVGVRLRGEPAVEQLGHERRALGRFVLGARALAHGRRQRDEVGLGRGHGVLLGGSKAVLDRLSTRF